LAITEKGKTAAELMIFARYVMFSEVYWHHAVRSATAMLQRLFCELYLAGNIDFRQFVHFSEDEAIRFFVETSKGTPMENLAQGLFGARRTIYKRVAQFSILEEPEMYRQLAGKPYSQLCELADRYCTEVNALPLSVLMDAPPVEKEVEIKIDVYFPKSDRYRALEDLSPVVRAMAREQFDDYAKRVRIFAHPDIAPSLREKIQKR
jgi:HD superfamily phosphohydrolase